MPFLTSEERAALLAAKAAHDALAPLKSLGEQLQQAIRAANTAELRRRGTHQSDTSTLPAIRMIDARHPGLRHAVTTLLRYLEQAR